MQLILAPKLILLPTLSGVIAAVALALFYRRWLGGVTGDLIGAVGEIVETIVLVAASL